MTCIQIVAFVVFLASVLYASWWTGYNEGREETMKEGAITIQRVMDELEKDGDFINAIADIPDGDYSEHLLTYAELAALDKTDNQNKKEQK